MKQSDTNVADSTHVLDQERVMYYSPSWQLLEERIAENIIVSSAIDRHQQYVWGVRYIDDIVLHRQDNNTDGDYTDTASPADAQCQRSLRVNQSGTFSAARTKALSG